MSTNGQLADIRRLQDTGRGTASEAITSPKPQDTTFQLIGPPNPNLELSLRGSQAVANKFLYVFWRLRHFPPGQGVVSIECGVAVRGPRRAEVHRLSDIADKQAKTDAGFLVRRWRRTLQGVPVCTIIYISEVEYAFPNLVDFKLE